MSIFQDYVGRRSQLRTKSLVVGYRIRLREFYGKKELNGLYSMITRYAISGIIDSAGDSKTENHFIAQNNDPEISALSHI